MLRIVDLHERKLERALEAGSKWQGYVDRRAETISKLRDGGPENADSNARVENFRARESAKQIAMLRAGVGRSFATERVIKSDDLMDTPITDAANVAGRPVGRIGKLNEHDKVNEGFATGFLISQGLLITNHHVFADESEARGCGVQFGYEKINGVLMEGDTFKLDPSIFFHANQELDYAIVGITPLNNLKKSIADYRNLSLDPLTGKILVGQVISIIQHPDGGPKQYCVRNNELLLAPTAEDLYLQYSTDTKPGSSGSPAFNKDWEVVALHSSGVPEVKDGSIMSIYNKPWRRGMSDTEINWVANEGARISCIYQSLNMLKPQPGMESIYKELIESFGEDFTKLPVLQAAQEVKSISTSQMESSMISIVVNGSANFYINSNAAPGAKSDASDTGALKDSSVDAIKSALGVTEKKIVFDTNYDDRPGYDSEFLGIAIPLPGVVPGRKEEMILDGGEPYVLNYHNYSLVMNRIRRTVMWAAANVNYSKKYRRKSREDFGTDTWVPDPRILGKYQIMDQELYSPALKFDRGHIIRRDDVAWGKTAKQEEFANSDSFHWTNCTAQHEAFNRDMYEYSGVGLWGMLENHIVKQSRNVDYKLVIFAGPVLSDASIRHNFGGGKVQVPLRFWKVIIVVEDTGTDDAELSAYGFILDQSYAIDDYGLERKEKLDFDAFEIHQKTLEDITAETGVTFDDALTDADAMIGAEEESRQIKIKNLEDVRLRPD